jgi:hypothetical protein
MNQFNEDLIYECCQILEILGMPLSDLQSKFKNDFENKKGGDGIPSK